MRNEKKKTVWILGAGFSKSLGGPLLRDFFSPRSWPELRQQYFEVAYRGGSMPRGEVTDDVQRLFGHEAALLYRVFNYGITNSEEWNRVKYGDTHNIGPGVRIWDDAEEFLEHLDGAKDVGLRFARYDVLSQGKKLDEVRGAVDTKKLAHTARRILAAQCCAFLRDNEPSREKWQPYVKWAAGLNNDDTLVTFNYDLVVEKACEHARKGLCVLTFHPDEQAQLTEAEAGNWPVLVKLHGSVDWKLNENPQQRARYVQSSDPEHAVKQGFDPEADTIAIATPGDGKQQRVKEFALLWEHAKKKIHEADRVVFLGYRFPESDAQARRELLGAIARNRNINRKLLELVTVLGDDIGSTNRLCALLEYAAGKSSSPYKLVRDALFVQDYLDVSSL